MARKRLLKRAIYRDPPDFETKTRQFLNHHQPLSPSSPSSSPYPAAMPRPSSLRQTNFGFSSLGGPAASASSSSSARQTSALAARIEAKKAELEHLRQLRDVSDALATQMEGLGEKLGTLRDGTEGENQSIIHLRAHLMKVRLLISSNLIISCRLRDGQLGKCFGRYSDGFW